MCRAPYVRRWWCKNLGCILSWSWLVLLFAFYNWHSLSHTDTNALIVIPESWVTVRVRVDIRLIRHSFRSRWWWWWWWRWMIDDIHWMINKWISTNDQQMIKIEINIMDTTWQTWHLWDDFDSGVHWSPVIFFFVACTGLKVLTAVRKGPLGNVLRCLQQASLSKTPEGGVNLKDKLV